MLRYRPRRWLVHLALAFGAGVYLGGGVAFSWLWLGAAGCCLSCDSCGDCDTECSGCCKYFPEFHKYTSLKDKIK